MSVKTQKLSGVYYYVNERSASQNYLVQMKTYGLIKFGVKNLFTLSCDISGIISDNLKQLALFGSFIKYEL